MLCPQVEYIDLITIATQVGILVISGLMLYYVRDNSNS